jgi:hypothetical protein
LQEKFLLFHFWKRHGLLIALTILPRLKLLRRHANRKAQHRCTK